MRSRRTFLILNHHHVALFVACGRVALELSLSHLATTLLAFLTLSTPYLARILAAFAFCRYSVMSDIVAEMYERAMCTFGFLPLPSLSTPSTSHPLFLFTRLIGCSLDLSRFLLFRDKPRRALAGLNGLLQKPLLLRLLHKKEEGWASASKIKAAKMRFERTRMAPMTAGAISSVRRL